MTAATPSAEWTRAAASAAKPTAGLVGQRVQRQDAGLLDDAEERQREVAGNAEDLARAVILQGVQQRIAPGSTAAPASARLENSAQRLLEVRDGAIDVGELVQAEEADAEGSEIGRLVALQRHAGGGLQAAARNFLPFWMSGSSV